MKNIYLREENKFIGYGGNAIDDFEREDLKVTFPSQIAGDCTIHNLKESLQYLYCKNGLDVGLLEVNLILGFDQFISENKLKLDKNIKMLSKNEKEDSSQIWIEDSLYLETLEELK